MGFAMKTNTRALIAASLLVLMATGCSTGYTKVDGEWTYIVINEAVGREVRKINADNATFHVLDDPDYATDKDHVYKCGVVLDGMDGSTFEFFGGNNYARDSKHIYYRDSVVLGADSATFRVLDFPYARDADNVYCGSLRMNVEDPNQFKVLESEDTGTSYFYSTDDLVKRLGDEFKEHEVPYDPKIRDMRYRIASSESGVATDGVWLFEGPKRKTRVR